MPDSHSVLSSVSARYSLSHWLFSFLGSREQGSWNWFRYPLTASTLNIRIVHNEITLHLQVYPFCITYNKLNTVESSSRKHILSEVLSLPYIAYASVPMAAFIHACTACGFCRLVKLSLHWHRLNPLGTPYCVLCTITNPKTLHKFFPFPLPPFRHTGHVCWCRKMFAQHISIYEHHNTLSSCHRFFSCQKLT